MRLRTLLLPPFFLYAALGLTACSGTEGEKSDARVEGSQPGDCTDRADNDSDGDLDCDDEGCSGSPDCADTGDTATDPNEDRDGDGYSPNAGDCDDANAQVHPGATDAATDGVDQNCDGVDGPDADGDGYADATTGGDDCDDADAGVSPDAEEVWGDGVDQDCDGFADVEDARCEAMLTVTTPNGATQELDFCQNWVFAAEFEYDPDNVPQLARFSASLDATDAVDFACGIEVVQDGVCDAGYYDLQDATSTVDVALFDCAGIPDAYETGFSASSGYLRIVRIETGSDTGSFSGVPLGFEVDGYLHASHAGFEIEGPISVAMRQLGPDGGSASECATIITDADSDGEIDTYLDGDDCDDADPNNYSANPEQCDGFDNDCNGVADAASETDPDGDGDLDCAGDNCPLAANPDQADHDGDRDGDACDDDDDDDRVNDTTDVCPRGDTGWSADASTDMDADGCQDAGEDTDDDNDGITDAGDHCNAGAMGWASSAATDHDDDGCEDASEDDDDDDDGVADGTDLCSTGSASWSASSATDRDSDGCEDAGEDIDDDGDGVADTADHCQTGTSGWSSSATTDHDGDGCEDASEDDDDDDGVSDASDTCAAGTTGWTSSTTTDFDLDGCKDASEDTDDDDDGVSDTADACARGATGWVASEATDNDSDGCEDASEDDDDDDDGVTDADDACATGESGWYASETFDHDGDGCRDSTEDTDDDDDGVSDANDACMRGASPLSSDHDGDGCDDSSEDTDDDDDGVTDANDSCATGTTGWTADTSTDSDDDGCEDAGEDTDDDDDGIPDRSDTCPYNDDPDCLYEGAGYTRTNVDVSGDAQPIVTGGSLMWQGCERGHSLYDCATGTAYLTDWYSQTTYCTDSTWAGYTDWRLPTITELESIVDMSVSGSPKINPSAFPNTTSGGDGAYASTVTSWNPVGRWFMQFSIGVSANAHYSNPCGVRCVRGR